jgi:hypothetical protein
MVDIEAAQPSDSYVHVRIGGEVDMSTRSQLADALRRAVDDHDGAVVIDLSAVRFFSAAGVHCVDTAVAALGCPRTSGARGVPGTRTGLAARLRAGPAPALAGASLHRGGGR